MPTETFDKDIYIDEIAAINMLKAIEEARRRPIEKRIDVRKVIDRSIALLPEKLVTHE